MKPAPERDYLVCSNIAGFPDYFVRDDGVVFRRNPKWKGVRAFLEGRVHESEKHRALKPTPRGDYFRVRMRGECGFEHAIPVHKIVLEAFVGPRPSPRHHGAHLDGDSSNNDLANLAWKTPEENEADKKVHGTHRNGPPTPLTPQAVRSIRMRVDRGESYSSIAKRFGLHRHSVSRIARGLRRAA